MNNEKKTIRGKHLVWMDVEMSGLDPKTAVILELACIVTDNELNVVAEAPVYVVHQPLSLLEGMDDWNREHHTASGLWDRVLASTSTIGQIDDELVRFLSQYMEPNTSPLCGNSIGQDRRFLFEYMPKLSAFLHYRNVDVSSLKELAARWYPELPEFRKNNNHRALDDIRESIEELRWYRERIMVRSASA